MIDIDKLKEAVNGIHNKQKGYELIKVSVDELERLQKKETPMKVIEKHYCPSCINNYNFGIDNYCSDCGQKLDWSDEK